MILAIATLTALVCAGQVAQPPVYYPGAGAGFPAPSWLGKGRTVTGLLGDVQKDRILLRSFAEGEGNVLCKVDEKTKIHIDKTVLSIDDLREGDPVAVKIKDVKKVGAYAEEIIPHPDVLKRKERGGTPEPAPAATELPATELPPAPGAPHETRIEAAPAAAAGAAPAATAAAKPSPQALTIPELPHGQRGLQGTIVALNKDEATLQLENGQKRQVLITSVTRMIRAGTRDQQLEDVRIGDRVAITGDALDTGIFIAREVWVNRAADAAPQVAESVSPATAAAATVAVPAPPEEKLSGDFTGVLIGVEGETLRVKTEDGHVRKVTATPITIIKKWDTDTPLQGLHAGDTLKISGDVMDDGTTLAHEIKVTPTQSKQ